MVSATFRSKFSIRMTSRLFLNSLIYLAYNRLLLISDDVQEVNVLDHILGPSEVQDEFSMDNQITPSSEC